MPQYSLRRGPGFAELQNRVRPVSITQRRLGLQILYEEQWIYVKERLADWIQRGDIKPNDAARSLEMERALRRQIENRFGWLLAELSTRQREVISPHQAAIASRQKQLWHWDAIGLRRANRQQIGSGKGIGVVLLDTGIDATHFELAGQSIRLMSVQHNGSVKRVRKATDPNGHGTYVAGLIAGKTIGIAPESKLVCVQVLSPEGTGNEWTILAGLNWVMTQRDIKVVVVCLSYAATPESTQLWQSAVEKLLDLDILPVIAAGNDGPGNVRIPGNTAGGLVVGAATRKKQIAPFSSSGNVKFKGRPELAIPGLIAPGENIYSALPGNKYNSWAGTTPATAIVAGVAALVRNRYPQLSASDVRDRILQRCRPVKSPRSRQGAGMVRIEAAL